jgi:hypothetical protein
MPEKTYFRLKIWGSLLLAASLASCSSPASQLVSGPTDQPPSIKPLKFSAPSTSPDFYSEEPSAPSFPASSSPASSSPASSSPASSSPASSSPASSLHASSSPKSVTPPSDSAVEVSNIPPDPTEEVLPPEMPFQPNSPSLAGISLGDSDKDVVKHYGLPAGTYPLPGDKQTVDIWEYAGFSIGLNTSNQVVYVEITSPDVDSGIKGLLSGMKGAQAAQILGVENDEHTNVLAAEVTGGWFKIDLDPETRQVLSLKLLSHEI